MSRFVLLASAFWFITLPAFGSEDDCSAVGDIDFVCGPVNAEDLVHVPDSRWIIASRAIPNGSLALIDTETRSWGVADLLAPALDAERYPDCTEPPIAEAFASHGLSLRRLDDGTLTLAVVGHGARESIEIYAVDLSAAKPMLEWRGCILTPGALAANSVSLASDGSLLATIPLDAGRTIPEAITGAATGAVYAWAPGDAGMTRLEGTELPYPNGIEIAEDGQHFYVVTSGGGQFIEFANTRPVAERRRSDRLDFVPDNLRRAPDGRMLTAGLVASDEVCGDVWDGEVFDLAAFAACPRPFVVRAIDPETFDGEDLLRGPRIETFSNLTIGIVIGESIWMGTFAGDRVALFEMD
ncbi:hypothetical protein [Wenzhouxiangella marina]|uniref:Uncharacterized protein n=1 Tax=Wenzhouxiangella marina TaxID=1579979 RepID=A0A0K0Y040_9GAMM|nr:hypothetical protein [Wenzhouxiangella marina]AKS43231.1 hypothetical protein WM2015_2874 [Wenzhouxiangella marina]MBB6087082.1 hypothetical protein [Wenzhouxiangella marina]